MANQDFNNIMNNQLGGAAIHYWDATFNEGNFFDSVGGNDGIIGANVMQGSGGIHRTR